MSTESTTIFVSRDGIDDIAVAVTGIYHRGWKGRRESKWDRFAPEDEQPYIEITETVVEKDVPDERCESGFAYIAPEHIDLTDAEKEVAEDQIIEAIGERQYD